MKRPRMTYAQRYDRRQATRTGQRAALYIRRVVDQYREAGRWRELAAKAGVDDSQARYWEGRAEKGVAEALREARRAWHLALDGTPGARDEAAS